MSSLEKCKLYLWFLFIFALCFCNKGSQAFPGNGIKPYIINGEETSIDKFPWQVRVDIITDMESYTCGGSLINEKWILTAAHCIDSPIMIDVQVGNIPPHELNVWTWKIHNDYNQYTLANDIALLGLDDPLEFSDVIRPIELTSEALEIGTDIIVSGYGALSDDSEGSNNLYSVTLSTIDNAECSQSYGQGIILDEMVCAVSKTNETQGICFGDNGGPAVVYQNDTPFLVAVSSFFSTRGCESGDPSGFIRVADYKSWIEENSPV